MFIYLNIFQNSPYDICIFLIALYQLLYKMSEIYLTNPSLEAFLISEKGLITDLFLKFLGYCHIYSPRWTLVSFCQVPPK